MKSKNEIQQELIKVFGKDFNTIDNLIKWLNSHYHPQIYTSMKEFIRTPYFHINEEMSVNEYTDDYITENDNYIIILFDDYRDFEDTSYKDKICGDIVISYNKDTRKIVKYFYTTSFNFINKSLKDIEVFYNN